MKIFPFFPRAPLPVRRRSAGSTLPATMMVVAVILSLLSAAAFLTSQNARFAGRQASKSDLLTASDAALEYAYSQWKTSTAAVIHGNRKNIPPASTWNNASGSVLTDKFNAAYANTGAFAAGTNVIASEVSIISTDQNGQRIKDGTGKDVSATDAPTGIDTNNVPGYPGWSGKSYNYLATATLTTSGHFGVSRSTTGGVTTGDNTVTVRRYFQVTTVPLFQAAIFYENDLEIHPGAKMVVTGLVHTNANFYALGMAAQVQFMNNVSYVGSYSEGSNSAVTRGWDGANTNASNTPENVNAYYNANYGTGLFPDLWKDGLPSNSSATRASQVNQVSTIDPFGGAKKSENGLHDIVEVPDAGTATSDQVAYNNASLRIIVDSSQSPVTYLITDGTGAKLSAADEANVKAAIVAPKVIADQRELSTKVTVTSLDMAKLAYATVPAATLTATKEFGTVTPAAGIPVTGSAFQNAFQGTVYIRDAAKITADDVRTAIRLINGRSLGQDVTVASDNGMYIQGDYNTGGTKASDVPSNGSDPTTPQATGYNRHSSAVMADAVTILSNSWLDANANAALSSRVATATTVNTAVLAGDVLSNQDGTGYASGGAHNFPRFLEDWGPPSSGKPYINFTYTGSLVEAFKSEKYIKHWQTNQVYRWPNRLWSFDTNFLVKQPPGVPTGIQFSRGRYERLTN